MKALAFVLLVACGDHKTVTIMSGHEYTIEASTSTEWGTARDVHVTVGPISAMKLILVPQLVPIPKIVHARCIEAEASP